MNCRILKVRISFFSTKWLFVVLLGLTACAKTAETEPISADYAYFPLTVNDFRIYDVIDSSITFNVGTPVIRHYRIKEEVAEKYIDLAGDTAYRINRFSCVACGSVYDPNWQLDSAWTAKLAFAPGKDTYNRAVRTENNRIFVKLVFPVAEGKTWNGNQLYSLADTLPDNIQTYRMGNVSKPYQNFPQTLLVVQNKDTAYNLQKHEKRIEIYAINVGLALRDDMYWEFDCTNGCFGRKKITQGRRIIYKLTDFGRK